jgi:hypothetical protein
MDGQLAGGAALMSELSADYVRDSAVPFEARQAMQRRIWERCISPGDNEWTTWTDAITLAETAAEALLLAGFEVRRIDGDVCA